MTGSSDVTVNRNFSFRSQMPSASPFFERLFSNSVAVISVNEPPESVNVKPVPGLEISASWMPEIVTAASDDPLLMTLSLLA